MFDYFCSTIGKYNNVPLRSAALLIDQKMFTTAWTGGRKLDGTKKFAFANHVTTIAFMNEVLRNVCGSQMSSSEFTDFIKSRTRNSGYIYIRTSNRQATARKNRKRKSNASTDSSIPSMQPPAMLLMQPPNMQNNNQTTTTSTTVVSLSSSLSQPNTQINQ